MKWSFVSHAYFTQFVFFKWTDLDYFKLMDYGFIENKEQFRRRTIDIYQNCNNWLLKLKYQRVQLLLKGFETHQVKDFLYEFRDVAIFEYCGMESPNPFDKKMERFMLKCKLKTV